MLDITTLTAWGAAIGGISSVVWWIGIPMACRNLWRFPIDARSASVAVVALSLCGCALVGPRSIVAGRGAYAEVINRTEDEQILNVIVRQRYDETFGMISVSSVTANLRFHAQVGAEIGFGDSSDTAGNLVPFAAGIAYEENPTISYVPLSGEDFIRRMLSPVTTREWVLLAAHARTPGDVLGLMARRVNQLRNPLLGDDPASPKFVRFLALYDKLLDASVVDVVQSSEAIGEYLWTFHDYEGTHDEEVRSVLDMLGIEDEFDGSPIYVPIRAAVGASDSAVHVETRSPFEVLRVFGAGIDLPPGHLEQGVVEKVEWAVSEDRKFIKIRSSEERPENATVRIRFRDRWFYIDETDGPSKRAFMFLRTFIGIRLAGAGSKQGAPVLTVPVN